MSFKLMVMLQVAVIFTHTAAFEVFLVVLLVSEMFVRGESEHQRNSLILLMAIFSAVASISSAVRCPAAHKCIINHGFILGKRSLSSFFHPFLCCSPQRGIWLSLMHCTHPIEKPGCAYMIYNKKSHTWLISYCCISAVTVPKTTRERNVFNSHIYRGDLLQYLYVNTWLMSAGNRKNSYEMAVLFPCSKLEHTETGCYQWFRHARGASVMSSLILQKANRKKKKAWLAAEGKK